MLEFETIARIRRREIGLGVRSLFATIQWPLSSGDCPFRAKRLVDGTERLNSERNELAKSLLGIRTTRVRRLSCIL